MFKRMKLASKLALAIGGALTFVFIALIGVTIMLARDAVSTATYETLNAVSKSNSLQIQQIFDAAETVATNMHQYMERAYKMAEEDPSQMAMPTEPEAMEMCRSGIYGKVLTALNYDVEVYLRETARNNAQYNDDIAGIGVMFEPYKFQSDIQDYAFYIDQASASKDIFPYGSYETYSQEVFYREASSARAPIITEPYDYNGITMITYASPIIYMNELQGITMADINITNFNKVDAANENYPSMYATIYDTTGKIIYDSEDDVNTGRNIADFTSVQSELDQMQAQMSGNTAFQIETTREGGRKVTRFFTPIRAADETWWSLTAVDTKDINAAVTKTVLWMLLLSMAALIIIILTVIYLLKKMLAPVDGIVFAAESIAEGHLDVQLQAASEDEIGILTKSFQKMSDMLKAMVMDVQYLLGEMASGNFDVNTKAKDVYVGDYEAFSHSVEKLSDMLSSALFQINESADQVSAGSEQVSAGSQALSQGATEQASSIEELAATINEISGQVKDTAQNAVEARAQTSQANEIVETCNQQMGQMLTAMGEISHKSSEIGKIIKTIEDIAFQTNILALNAAVEAARAGAAGKGFAVVADEVRNLAGKSAEASKNTAALIEGSLRAVEQGAKIADDTAASLSQVVQGTQLISATVDKITNAANEQASSITQVTQGIDQISSVVQTNSATAEESAAASEELSGQAQMLKDLVSQFRLGKKKDK